MRPFALLAAVLLFLMSASLVLAQDPRRYTVQAGDNLFTIANRYGVSVQALAQANNITNPNVLEVGQVLIIPPASTTSAQPEGTATPSPVPATGQTRSHLVIDGESLYQIAARFNTTVVAIAQLNNITDFNLISVGQRLVIPPAGASAGNNAGTGGATTNAPAVVTPFPNNQAEAVNFERGIQVNLEGADSAAIVAQVQDLGMGWVNQALDWATFEPEQGQIDFEALDALISPLDEAGLNILLTVSNAPAWARSGIEGIGAPTNDASYAAFIGAVAARYRGVVDAYEIWSQPNITSQWAGRPIGATAYMNLLKVAYNAVKQADPTALVVSAGLAPTAVNDGSNAIDDRTFLRQLYQAGLKNFSDAIGVRAAAWANPPDSTCCRNNRPTIAGWDDNPSFFFLTRLGDYRKIMNDNNDGGKFLWVTYFGWGSAEGIGGQVPEGLAYVTYTSAEEQAQYTVRAFQKAQELTYIGPMFLSNLNLCDAEGGITDCYWSVLAVDGTPRPVFDALAGE